MKVSYDGQIEWTSWSKITFPCHLNMSGYPSDSHICPLHLFPIGEFEPGLQWHTCDTRLSRYFIQNSAFIINNVSVSNPRRNYNLNKSDLS